mgnify:CR=1 FL=1
MSQSKASGRKSVAGMGSIRKKEKVINGKAYTYYEARYTVGIDPGTGKQIQKSIFLHHKNKNQPHHQIRFHI